MVLSHKAKQYLLAALKLFILLGSGYYIYYRLTNTYFETSQVWSAQLRSDSTMVFMIIILALIGSLINWGLEAKKWQLLVNSRYVIDYKTAWRQTYGAFTASLLTPQRVGEYGAKALYYPKEARKAILWLTFLGNSAQLLITLIFGIVGLIGITVLFQLEINTLNIILIGVSLLFMAALGYLLREQELLFQGLSINNLIKKLKALSWNLKSKVIGLALGRYLIFGGLFYVTIGILGVWIEPFVAVILLGAYYFLTSVTPSLFLLDVVVKGGIGIWIFSLYDIPESIILAAIVFNWVVNTVFTQIIGSYYVLKFTPSRL
ncbi:MAG: hypothetical protein ABJM06_12995 [Gilvibacter sp.]